MSVGMLQSECFDCVFRADSKSHLIIGTAGRARGVFWMNHSLTLNEPREILF